MVIIGNSIALTTSSRSYRATSEPPAASPLPPISQPNLGLDQTDKCLARLLQRFSQFENGCQRGLLLNKVQNADEGSPLVGFKPELLPVNQLFRISHQFRWLDIERSSQFEDSAYRRLILPSLNQRNEIALHTRLKTQLFLAKPSGQSMLAQDLPESSMR